MHKEHLSLPSRSPLLWTHMLDNCQLVVGKTLRNPCTLPPWMLMQQLHLLLFNAAYGNGNDVITQKSG